LERRRRCLGPVAVRDQHPAGGRVALTRLRHPLPNPALECLLPRHLSVLPCGGRAGTHAPDAPPDRATVTGVPMAQGHLYLPRPAAWAPGRRWGAGARLSDCRLSGPAGAAKLIARRYRTRNRFER